MSHYIMNRVTRSDRRIGQKITIATGALIFFLCFLPATRAIAQQLPNKIQQMIDAIKAVNNNENDDYITDGQRTVWVKSYKRWEPADLNVMKKEDPATLRFLGMAAQHARYDVLGQLLPDYYRAHGGAKAFADDILRISPPATYQPKN